MSGKKRNNVSHNSSFFILAKTEPSVNNSERDMSSVFVCNGKTVPFLWLCLLKAARGCDAGLHGSQVPGMGSPLLAVGWTTQMMASPPCLGKYLSSWPQKHVQTSKRPVGSLSLIILTHGLLWAAAMLGAALIRKQKHEAKHINCLPN